MNPSITIKNVTPIPGGDAFLIITKERSILIDSGFSFSAPQMIENILLALHGRSLDYCLLTHSHYDHASGSAYLKDHFPQVVILASQYAAGILQKPSAIAIMVEMNQAAATEHKVESYENKLDQLQVDQVVGEGDIIHLGDQTLQIVEAPGHTKCAIAAYMPEEQLFIACETMGVYVEASSVAPCYLVSCKQSIDFIQRVIEFNPEHILVPHYGVLSGTECRRFMANSWRCAELLRDLILEEHRNGKTYEEILARYKQEFYRSRLHQIQPEAAFDLNASYLIPMVIREG